MGYTLLGRFLGVFVALVGVGLIALGAYLGLWLMLIGGIVDIVNQCKAPSTDGVVIGLAVVKIIFCEVPIVLGFWIGLILTALGLKAAFHSNR
jgi:hypothetical protein